MLNLHLLRNLCDKGTYPLRNFVYVVPHSLQLGGFSSYPSGSSPIFDYPLSGHGFYAGFFIFFIFNFPFSSYDLLMFTFPFIVSEQGIAVECLGSTLIKERPNRRLESYW